MRNLWPTNLNMLLLNGLYVVWESILIMRKGIYVIYTCGFPEYVFARASFCWIFVSIYPKSPEPPVKKCLFTCSEFSTFLGTVGG